MHCDHEMAPYPSRVGGAAARSSGTVHILVWSGRFRRPRGHARVRLEIEDVSGGRRDVVAALAGLAGLPWAG
jgi:hypothetical protein